MSKKIRVDCPSFRSKIEKKAKFKNRFLNKKKSINSLFFILHYMSKPQKAQKCCLKSSIFEIERVTAVFVFLVLQIIRHSGSPDIARCAAQRREISFSITTFLSLSADGGRRSIFFSPVELPQSWAIETVLSDGFVFSFVCWLVGADIQTHTYTTIPSSRFFHQAEKERRNYYTSKLLYASIVNVRI